MKLFNTLWNFTSSWGLLFERYKRDDKKKFLIFVEELFILEHSLWNFFNTTSSSSFGRHKKSDDRWSVCPGNKAPHFGHIWHFLGIFRALYLGTSLQPMTLILFTQNYFKVCIFTCSKEFLNDINFWANNGYNADQVFLTPALWSDLCKVPFLVLINIGSTYQKELKIGQCLQRLK